METSYYVKFILAGFLSIALILVTTSVHNFYTTPLDKQTSVDTHVDSTVLKYEPFNNRDIYTHEKYYAGSNLAAFASQHRERLRSAKHDRGMQCGTIVKVSALDCAACSLFVTAAKTLVERGGTQSDVISLAKTACVDLQIEDERVCDAIVVEFKVSTKLSIYNRILQIAN